MPECYEVYRIKTYLDDANIYGQNVENVSITPAGFRCFKSHNFDDVQSFFLNNPIVSVQTKAKYTVINFSRGSLLCHYRFTGLFHVSGIPYGNRLMSIHSLPLKTYTPQSIRFTLTLNSGKALMFVDTRCLSHLHINPLKTGFEAFTQLNAVAEDMYTCNFPSHSQTLNSIKSSQMDLKTWLQDQRFPPSGIGNYLACELCHHAQLSPWMIIKNITSAQYKRLLNAFHHIHKIATSRADYEWFSVYNQTNCTRCNKPVIREKHRGKNSQSTWWCPACVLA